jgi:hypothetical protein
LANTFQFNQNASRRRKRRPGHFGDGRSILVRTIFEDKNGALIVIYRIPVVHFKSICRDC